MSDFPWIVFALIATVAVSKLVKSAADVAVRAQKIGEAASKAKAEGRDPKIEVQRLLQAKVSLPKATSGLKSFGRLLTASALAVFLWFLTELVPAPNLLTPELVQLWRYVAIGSPGIILFFLLRRYGEVQTIEYGTVNDETMGRRWGLYEELATFLAFAAMIGTGIAWIALADPSAGIKQLPPWANEIVQGFMAELE